MAPSISLRESIRWLPAPASEPTTTLVLTSTNHKFVDIRILNPDDDTNNTNNTTNNDTIGSDLLPLSRLDWAFAGTSSSRLRPSPTEPGELVIHSQWAHWVSNRARDVDDVVDEGDMYPQGEGGRVLEVGRMVNPATGRPTDYEEVWLDPPPVATGGGSGRKVCAVLQLHDDANEARGVVVRVGQFCQGVLRVGEVFALERWEWTAEKGWRRSVRMGDLWLPCGVLFEEGKVALGGEVRHGEFLWKCLEWEEF